MRQMRKNAEKVATAGEGSSAFAAHQPAAASANNAAVEQTSSQLGAIDLQHTAHRRFMKSLFGKSCGVRCAESLPQM